MNHQDPIVLDEATLAEVSGGASRTLAVADRSAAVTSYLSAFSAKVDVSSALRNLGVQRGSAVLDRFNLDRFAIGGSHPI